MIRHFRFGHDLQSGSVIKEDKVRAKSCFLIVISVIGLTVKSELHYTSKYQRDELRIKKALLFIEMNYGNAITIVDIADSAGISVSSCLRLFCTIIGNTPIRYLVRLRLQKAAEEFQRKNEKTIAETA